MVFMVDFECVFGYQVVKPQWKVAINFTWIRKNNAPIFIFFTPHLAPLNLQPPPRNEFPFFLCRLQVRNSQPAGVQGKGENGENLPRPALRPP
jgi:hypothetical protein